MDNVSDQKCPASLRRQIEEAPQTPANLILRVQDVGEARRAAIEEAGFKVRHKTTLVPAFAVAGPVKALAPLLAEPWLIAVETDREVRAF